MTLRRPRRWSALSRVERVDLYTRASLYVMLAGFAFSLLLAAATAAADAGERGAIVAGGVVVLVAATVVLRAVVDNHPARGPLPWPWVAVLLLGSVGYLLVPGTSSVDTVQATVTAMVIGNVAAALGGIPDHRVSAAVVAGGAVLGGLRGEASGVVSGAVLAAFLVFAVRASLWVLDVVSELDAARNAVARLAVAEERLRFSRDVHDVLGRRLSTIAVQAELAATLAARGDERSAEKMLEVRAVAHEALAEARELARGYRPTDLATELEGARSLLRSAGIDVELAVDVVPRAWHEAAGWVVRESVTNVLRHSAATRVRIELAGDELRVSNDGVRAGPPASGGGAGLDGLRERLSPLGASLTTTASPGSWTVVAHLPGSGPLSATTTRSPA
ncbi:sensor histidine kinase [Nocardioides dongxiaopingii]|uniref:sensor histidine kinase n=1 Tax=Nocardioides sp. S-1144 TaxID=2582905 RepID=UPI0011641962|nr:histidine kinase [Nocardioides sp. S-1144]QCW49892.2 sensor histidine kinase [Nocardioides sp. S-1144]